MSKRVGIDGFADELVSLFKEYTEEVTEGMEDVKEKVAKEGVKALKQTSPVGRRSRKKYKDGWRAKKVGTAWVVHNATNYQLTHLLEKGHALRQGGRTRAFPHIAPAEEMIIKDFEKRLERVIKG